MMEASPCASAMASPSFFPSCRQRMTVLPASAFMENLGDLLFVRKGVIPPTSERFSGGSGAIRSTCISKLALSTLSLLPLSLAMALKVCMP